MEEILRCDCGWELTWREYFKTIQHAQLSGAEPVLEQFRAFISNFSIARTPQKKTLAIDRLIHGFHWYYKTNGPTRPVAVNLIEGSMSDIVAFLDRLTNGVYGDKSTPGLRENYTEWNRNIEVNRDWYRTRRKKKVEPKNAESDPVDDILAKHGVSGPWKSLQATGVANRIYATQDVVLRIATNHPEAVCDARTESIAAPVAYAAGVMTPRLLAFDDTRTVVDRPYSLWERVHGETLGLYSTDSGSMPNTWRSIGQQLYLLHNSVKECPDPNGYLDKPERNLQLDVLLGELLAQKRVDKTTARDIGLLIEELQPRIDVCVDSCFCHNDLHDMNVICTQNDSLLAIIDWGDAGWGDPTSDFFGIPINAIPFVMSGYGTVKFLGKNPLARIAWDKLSGAMEECRDDQVCSLSVTVDQLRTLASSEEGELMMKLD